jgi:hypothetical protein
MTEILGVVGVLFCLALLKWLRNYRNLHFLRGYLQQYERYLAKSNPEDAIVKGGVVEAQTEIIRLFKGAGIVEPHQPYVQPLGLGRIYTDNMSAWTNLHLPQMGSFVLVSFHEAIGFYEARRREALSVTYWFDFLIFFPRIVAEGLGLRSDQMGVKIAQAAFWLASFVAAVVSIVK